MSTEISPFASFSLGAVGSVMIIVLLLLLRDLKRKTDRELITLSTLEYDIWQALINSEFCLHYQPQYSLTENRITGVEALIRWEHPEEGLLYPDKFIPVAEKLGSIVAIDYWVLREACRQHREWANPDLTLSVNLSALQFQQEDLVHTVKTILDEEGMNPAKLSLEITETQLVKDVTKTTDILHELNTLGISISLDDFGIGFTSLTYLQNFPVKSLKIDRSFIGRIADSRKSRVIIENIVKMAKSMNIGVVAEGIEDSKQLSFLRDLSCDHIQGYLLSPPIPSLALEEFLTTDYRLSDCGVLATEKIS